MTRQPQGVVRVVRGNSLGVGPAFLYAPQTGVDIVSGRAPTTVTSGVSAGASGLMMPGDGGYRGWATSRALLTTNMTIFVLAKMNWAQWAGTTFFCNGNAYSNGTRFGCYYEGSNAYRLIGPSGFNDLIIATGVNVAKIHTLCLSIAGGVTNGSYASFDGIYKSPVTVPNIAISGTASTLVGRSETASDVVTSNAAGTETYLVAMWQRALSRVETDQLHANPWSLFAYPPQPLYTGMGSGSYTPLEVCP